MGQKKPRKVFPQSQLIELFQGDAGSESTRSHLSWTRDAILHTNLYLRIKGFKFEAMAKPQVVRKLKSSSNAKGPVSIKELPKAPRQLVERQIPQPMAVKATKGKQSKRRTAFFAVFIVVIMILTAFSVLFIASAPPTPTGDTVLSDKLRRPESNPSLQNVIVGNDSITFIYSSNPGTLNYSVGDYIVGTSDHGYLRKITDVQNNENIVTVQTTNASLSDVIQKGRQNTTFHLKPDNATATISPLNSSQTLSSNGEQYRVRIQSESAKSEYSIEKDLFEISIPNVGISIDWWDEQNQRYKNGVSLSVEELKLSSRIEVNLEINVDLLQFWAPLQYARFSATQTEKIEFNGITITGYLSSDNDLLEKKIHLLDLPLGGLVVPICGIPVTFDFDLSVEAGFKAILGVSAIAADFSYEYISTCGREFTNGQWNDINSGQTNLELNLGSVDISASLEFDEFIYVGLVTEIYGGVGKAGIYLSPYLFEVLTVGQEPRVKFEFGPGVSCYLELELDVCIWKMNADVILFDIRHQPFLTYASPSSPRNLVALADDTKVTLTWNSPLSNGGLQMQGYRIYRGTASGTESLLVNFTNGYTFVDNNVTNGVTYYYIVCAKNLLGEGRRSNEVSAVPSSGPMVPEAPRNLVTVAGNGSISLSWQAPSSNGGSAITNYRIYRGTSSGAEIFLIEVGNTLSYTDGGLTNGITYYYQASALNSVGESIRSNETHATPIQTGSGNWTRFVIDHPGWASWEDDQSMDVDSNGYLHVIYTDSLKNLRYATNSGGSWANSTLVTGMVGRWPTMTLDLNNKVHISYFDTSANSIVYMTNAGGSWTSSTIAAGNLGIYPCITVDNNSRAYITYADLDSGYLKYATNASGSWLNHTLDISNGGLYNYAPITMDSNGKLHVVYWDATKNSVKYLTDSSGSWVISTLDAGNIGLWPCIAVDSTNYVHITYTNCTSKKIMYVNNIGGSWQYQAIDSGPYWAESWAPIAIDSNDKIHIIYMNNTAYDLEYATNVQGSWVIYTIDTGDIGWYPVIAIGPGNKVYAVYHDAIDDKLEYAFKS